MIFCNFCAAQEITPEKLGFSSNTLMVEKIGEVDYYLSIDSINISKPLLVYLDGSGAFPLFQKISKGIGSTVVLDFNELKNDYRILLISKPGIPFIDTVGNDDNGFPLYEEPSEYKEKLSLNWRVSTADNIIDYLIDKKLISPSKVVVLGFSEGAQVAPFLARTNKNVTHLLLFGGNGLNQFFDPIISVRMKAITGQLSEAEAQKDIDSLFTQYESIYNDPLSTNKNWWGHTYKRWSSFTQEDPYKCLLDLNIPIYFANGSLDENSVLSADYIKLEFIKNRKQNLTYKTYSSYDHQFNEIVFEKGEFKETIPRLTSVMGEAFRWLDQN